MKAEVVGRFLTLSLVATFFLGAVPAEGSDWLIRLRAINVDPDSSSSAVRSDGSDLAGTGVSVNDDTVPELDITYMVKPNIGIELVLATTQHDVYAEGGLATFLGDIPAHLIGESARKTREWKTQTMERSGDTVENYFRNECPSSPLYEAMVFNHSWLDMSLFKSKPGSVMLLLAEKVPNATNQSLSTIAATHEK